MTVWHKIRYILFIGLLVIFLSSYYIQSLAALSTQSIHSDQKLQQIEDIFEENQQKLETLTEEYNAEYAKRAQNIAYLFEENPSLVDNDKLRILARRAQVESIYVFNEKGSTVATNTSFTNFALSKSAADPSFALLNIISVFHSLR